MASRTPSIPMANPFQGSFLLETNTDAVTTHFAYLAVKRGSLDERVQPLNAAEADVERGVEMEGIMQYDANVGEWVAVRYFGVTWAWASENIVRDDPLDVISSAVAAQNGRMRRILPGTVIAAGGMIAGIALENGASGEKFKVFLTRQVQVDLS